MNKYERLLRKLRQIIFQHPNPGKCHATLMKVKNRVLKQRPASLSNNNYCETMWI